MQYIVGRARPLEGRGDASNHVALALAYLRRLRCTTTTALVVHRRYVYGARDFYDRENWLPDMVAGGPMHCAVENSLF